MKKTKVIFYKAKWRELRIKMLGGRDVTKDKRRKLASYYVMYYGKPRALSDNIVDSSKIEYI